MLELDALLIRLEQLDRLPSDSWMHTLSERKRRELEFHDAHRDRADRQRLDEDTYERLYGNKKFYSTTALSNEYVERWIRENAPDRVFLDYACGNGFNAIKAAKAGAKLSIGLDISPLSIQNAKDDAKAEGVEKNIYFVQADAEDTRLPSNSVERIICSGMLHHLDLSFAFPELRRILVPGGKLLAVEALDYNPAIKLYRYLTPTMRTEWETAHILDMADIQFARRFFDIGELKFWHVTSVLGAYLPAAARVLDVIDGVVTSLPLVKYLAWIFTFELIKRDE